MTEPILIAIIIFLTIHYIFFLLKIYLGLNKLNDKKDEKYANEFISVIVPFRNEEKNIANTYKNLIEQNYPKEMFEIIFVNDSSDDTSLHIIKNFPKVEIEIVFN